MNNLIFLNISNNIHERSLQLCVIYGDGQETVYDHDYLHHTSRYWRWWCLPEHQGGQIMIRCSVSGSLGCGIKSYNAKPCLQIKLYTPPSKTHRHTWYWIYILAILNLCMYALMNLMSYFFSLTFAIVGSGDYKIRGLVGLTIQSTRLNARNGPQEEQFSFYSYASSQTSYQATMHSSCNILSSEHPDSTTKTSSNHAPLMQYSIFWTYRLVRNSMQHLSDHVIWKNRDTWGIEKQ